MVAIGLAGNRERHRTYRMRFVGSAGEVDHAIEARKGCSIALVTVSIKLLLREDVSTALDRRSKPLMHLQGRDAIAGRGKHTSQENETIAV
jgi:hypothetical protein